MDEKNAAALVALAQRQADRLHGAEAVPEWRPSPRAGRRRLVFPAAALVVGAIAAVAFEWWEPEAAGAPPPAAPAATVHPAGLWAPSAADATSVTHEVSSGGEPLADGAERPGRSAPARSAGPETTGAPQAAPTAAEPAARDESGFGRE